MDAIKAVADRLGGLDGCAVCFSGGLDSTVLADIAHRVLGDRAVAVVVDVPMMTDRQRRAAKTVADSIGIRMIIAEAGLEDLAGILENRHDRCYICKTAMYRAIRKVAGSEGITAIVNGEIVDDLSEDRPGMAAGKENGILTPFLDAGVRRRDIVGYLKSMDLPLKLVKDTCMLMRYPEGTPVTMEDLRTVEELESVTRDLLGITRSGSEGPPTAIPSRPPRRNATSCCRGWMPWRRRSDPEDSASPSTTSRTTADILRGL